MNEGCTRSHPHENMNEECERLTAYTRAMRAPLDRSPTLDDSNFVQYADEQIDAWDFIADLSFAAKVVGAVLALGFVLALSGGWLYISWPQMVVALSI